ncbi:MAG: FHIPEP family type III secretion protein, partial [Planctomycetes bacterium]|nr:FHIPEP family type III secretion protein [Planctomycetota bacterium]
DPEVLTEYVRNALRRSICGQYATARDGGKLKLVCVTLDPSLEDIINGYIDRSPAGTTVNMPARVANQIADHVARSMQLVTSGGYPPVVVASPQVRAVVRQVLEPHIAGVAVLGYNELIPSMEVESVALVMAPEALTQPAMAA